MLDIQRYEGASTLYGPHTLAAYQMLYSQMATALAKGVSVPPGPTPPDISGKTVLTIRLSIYLSINQTNISPFYLYVSIVSFLLFFVDLLLSSIYICNLQSAFLLFCLIIIYLFIYQ